MPPIGGSGIPAKSSRESFCNGGTQFRGKWFFVFKPHLKVLGRGFHNKGRFKSIFLQVADCRGAEVIDHREVVLSFRPAEDISVIAVLPTKPRNGPDEGIRIPCARDHNNFSIWDGRVNEPISNISQPIATICRDTAHVVLSIPTRPQLQFISEKYLR